MLTIVLVMPETSETLGFEVSPSFVCCGCPGCLMHKHMRG
jgi:hypothetical protein